MIRHAHAYECIAVLTQHPKRQGTLAQTRPRGLSLTVTAALLDKDKSGSQSHGLTKVTFKIKKAGPVRFQAASRNVDLARFTGPSLVATLRAGRRCAGATVALRSKGKGFVYP